MKLSIRLLSLVGVMLVAAATAPAQTPRTGRMMRNKLVHTQRILAALTTSNQTLLEKETDALSRIAQSPQWMMDLHTPELAKYTDAFQKAVADLSAAATRHDLDAASAAYATLTTTCYQCHKHLMDTRIAGAALPVLPRHAP